MSSVASAKKDVVSVRARKRFVRCAPLDRHLLYSQQFRMFMLLIRSAASLACCFALLRRDCKSRLGSLRGERVAIWNNLIEDVREAVAVSERG
jgi:hypothetical protein